MFAKIIRTLITFWIENVKCTSHNCNGYHLECPAEILDNMIKYILENFDLTLTYDLEISSWHRILIQANATLPKAFFWANLSRTKSTNYSLQWILKKSAMTFTFNIERLWTKFQGLCKPFKIALLTWSINQIGLKEEYIHTLKM